MSAKTQFWSFRPAFLHPASVHSFIALMRDLPELAQLAGWRCGVVKITDKVSHQERVRPLYIMISGCSGGGKSSLLAELLRRGRSVVAEPGRRIIAEARNGDGSTLPWVNAAAFARRALEVSISDFKAGRGLTFFDRGIVDAAVAIAATGGAYPRSTIESMRYDLVYLAPPWPEIFVNDEDRRHNFEQALSDYEGVRLAYLDAGYDPILLPRDNVEARANFVMKALPAE